MTSTSTIAALLVKLDSKNNHRNRTTGFKDSIGKNQHFQCQNARAVFQRSMIRTDGSSVVNNNNVACLVFGDKNPFVVGARSARLDRKKYHRKTTPEKKRRCGPRSPMCGSTDYGHASYTSCFRPATSENNIYKWSFIRSISTAILDFHWWRLFYD